MKNYNREEIINELDARFKGYSFDIRPYFFIDRIHIKTSEIYRKKTSEDYFKTTIIVGEYPINEDHMESICGILVGTIQILKLNEVI